MQTPVRFNKGEKIVTDYRSYPGASFLVSLGSWAGFKFNMGKAGIRANVGWLSIGIYFFELEGYTTDAVSHLRNIVNDNDGMYSMVKNMQRRQSGRPWLHKKRKKKKR